MFSGFIDLLFIQLEIVYVHRYTVLIDQNMVFLLNEQKKIQFNRCCILSVMYSSVPKEKVEVSSMVAFSS